MLVKGLAAVALLLAGPAGAETRGYQLKPGSAVLAFRAYGLGLIPIEGTFTRFAGTLSLDEADPAFCALDLRAEAASLQMPNADMTEDALGPDLLDAGRFPDFAFKGACHAGQLQGLLLLHGVSRPLVLQVMIAGGRWIATGPMRRAEWGMGARPLLAGPEVRLQVTAAIPAGFPARR